MTNTTKRIVSAIVMIAGLAIIIASGRTPFLWLTYLMGILCLDEMICNFLKKKRFQSKTYWINMVIYLGFYYYLFFMEYSVGLAQIVINSGLILNLLLAVYLFAVPMHVPLIRIFSRKIFILPVLMIGLPIGCLSAAAYMNQWVQVLISMFLIVYGMDSSAWFVGKNLGRTKLWPSVSPNKTVEGLLGGALLTMLIATWIVGSFFGSYSWKVFVAVFILAICAQIGDLVQSKFKRQSEIKDSSNLIPGHGGLYDRLDSLLFVVPIIAFLLTL